MHMLLIRMRTDKLMLTASAEYFYIICKISHSKIRNLADINYKFLARLTNPLRN